MVKKNPISLRYLFSCGLLIFSTSFFSYSFGDEKNPLISNRRKNENKIKIDQLRQESILNSGLQIEIDKNKNVFFVIDKENRKVCYPSNHTKNINKKHVWIALDNISYHSSDKSGRWHCIKVPHWTFESKFNNIDSKNVVIIKTEMPHSDGIRVKRQVPHLQLDHKLIKAREKFCYVLFNLEQSISIKMKSVEVDQEGFLIVDSYKIFSMLLAPQDIFRYPLDQDNVELNKSSIDIEVQENYEENDIRIEEDDTGTGFFLVDNKNRSIHYKYNNEEYLLIIPDKIRYHSSDKSSRWHCIEIPYWSLFHHINLKNLLEKPNIVIKKIKFSNQQHELIKRKVPCIEQSNDLRIATEIFHYVVFNLEKNLKLKIDFPKLDKDNHLIIDSSMIVPDFDEGVPEGWKVDVQHLVDSNNNLLKGKDERTFYIRKAQFKDETPILSLHMVTSQRVQWINLSDQIERTFSRDKKPGEKKFLVDYLIKEIMRNKCDLSEENDLNLTSDFNYDYCIKCNNIQNKNSDIRLFIFTPNQTMFMKFYPQIEDMILNKFGEKNEFSLMNSNIKKIQLKPMNISSNWICVYIELDIHLETIHSNYFGEKNKNIYFYFYNNLSNNKIIVSAASPHEYGCCKINLKPNIFPKNSLKDGKEKVKEMYRSYGGKIYITYDKDDEKCLCSRS